MENTPLSIRRVRRKESFVGRRGADSSELSPSPHSSIFDAFYFSNSNSEESNNNTVVETLPISTVDDASNILSNDEHEHEFLYGRGTVLDTIVEQKSIATLSTTTRTKSVDEFRRDSITGRQFPLINHRDSLTIAKVRRQQSFSLDDLSTINRSYHDACRNISGTSTARSKNKHAPVQEIYAQPRTPVENPPERPLTPEGMPSWTASQQPTSTGGSNTGNQQGRSSRLQRLFGVHPSNFTPPQSRSASAPVRGGRAPRYRPPRSVYGGLASHPFATAPVAKARQIISFTLISPRTPSSQLPQPSRRHRLGQSIRSNQTGGADSSMLSLHTALQTYYPSPARPTQPASNSPRPSHRCPHYKGRLAALKALAASASAQLDQTGAYVPLNSEPSSASSSPARLPHIREDGGSISISAPNLSRPSISIPEVTCWKCRVEHVGSIIDGWWVKSASFLCYVCCGIDINDEADGAAGARWIGVSHGGVSVREWDVEMRRERESQRVDEMRDRRTVRAVLSEIPVLL